MKKNNTFLAMIGALAGVSIIYSAINAVLDGISRTWTPANTDMIARSIASGAWMLGLSLSVVVLAIGAAIVSFTRPGGSQGHSQSQGKQIEGTTVPQQPYMLSDGSENETEYIGLDSYTASNSYIDNSNNV